ncbi:MAG: hypothetical protein ACTSQY_02805 [Candidatus Odinarchaeia archaeon]
MLLKRDRAAQFYSAMEATAGRILRKLKGKTKLNKEYSVILRRDVYKIYSVCEGRSHTF